MSKQIRDTKKLLDEARRLFADADYYNNEQLLGCLRLINATYGGTQELSANSILISGIQRVVGNLEGNLKQIAILRFWKKYTLATIGEIYCVSLEWIRKLENKIVTIMRQGEKEFSIDKKIEFFEEELKLLNSIKNGDCVNYCQPITMLGLSKRALNCFEGIGVTTVKEILDFSSEDLFKIPGMGETTVAEVIARVQEKFPGWTPKIHTEYEYCSRLEDDDYNRYQINDNVLSLSINKINLSLRALNCLNRAGINTVGKLLDTPEEVLVKIKGFGEKCLKDVRQKKSEIISLCL